MFTPAVLAFTYHSHCVSGGFAGDVTAGSIGYQSGLVVGDDLYRRLAMQKIYGIQKRSYEVKDIQAAS